MPDLGGRVAVVTGASKGVALGLAESGATVYATGRSVSGESFGAEDRIKPVRCDHADDREVGAAFRRVFEEQGRLDVLVNNVWGGYEKMVEGGEFTWMRPFWEQPVWRWDAMFTAGVRAHYVGSRLAARKMVEQRGGLIVNISFWAAQKHIGNVAYGVSKAATDKLTADTAHELREYGLTDVDGKRPRPLTLEDV